MNHTKASAYEIYNNVYWNSSQYKKWTFSSLPQKGVDEVMYENECIELLDHYAVEMFKDHGDAVHILIATSRMILKRYLLKKNIRNQDKHLLVFAVLAIVCKLEIKELDHEDKILPFVPAECLLTSKLIALCESDILNCINFDLLCYHAYDYITIYSSEHVIPVKVLQGAWNIINDTYKMGDFIFLYPPYLMATAALLLASADADERRSNDYLVEILSQKILTDTTSLETVVNAIANYYNTNNIK